MALRTERQEADIFRDYLGQAIRTYLEQADDEASGGFVFIGLMEHIMLTLECCDPPEQINMVAAMIVDACHAFALDIAEIVSHAERMVHDARNV